MLTDLRRVAYVLEVVQAGSFSGAANALGVAQSTITKGVAEVEAQAGADLFHRSSTGVSTTEAGEIFVRRARKLLHDAEALVEETQNWRQLAAGHLKIGVSPLASLRFIKQAIGSFCRAFPLVNVSLEPTSEAIAIPKLVVGELDILIAAEASLARWSSLRKRVICSIDCAFFVRKGHPLVHKPVMERDLLALPMIVPTTADPLLSDMAVRVSANDSTGLKQRYRCDDFETILEIIRSTDACSPLLLPSGSAPFLDDEFHVFRDVVKMPEQRLLAVQPKNRKSSPAAREMLRYLIRPADKSAN